MSHCIEKLPHSCGSSDALQVFEDDGKYTGYCFACDTYVPHPYGDGGPSQEAKDAAKNKPDFATIKEEILTLPSRSLAHRGLREESLAWYDVRVSLSEVDGQTPVVVHYPFTIDGHIVGYKNKLVAEKRIWVNGDFKCKLDLFGWEQALSTGAKKLFITEGEEDALALYQALRDKQVGTPYEDMRPAVTSLTRGASGARKDILNNRQKIEKNFKEVILVFDRDEAGAKAEEEVLRIMPQAHTVSIPGKDANECVLEGRSKALATACLFKTSTPKNTRLVTGASLHEEARTPIKYGLSYPWDGLTKLTRGMRFGETYYCGAGVKMGKSTVRSALAVHLMQEHGEKVFMAAPEEANAHTYRLLCGQVAHKIFHDPEVEFDYDAFDKAGDVIKDRISLLNLYQHVGWSTLRSDIIAAAEDGYRCVFIDPITNLTNGVPSSEANIVLQGVAQDLASMALDYNLIVWIFCHLKSPESGPPHERGGHVYSHQFAGSRAMMRSCHMMMGLEGDKDPELEKEERNIRKLVILEDRQFGASGIVPIYYNDKTGTCTEIQMPNSRRVA